MYVIYAMYILSWSKLVGCVCICVYVYIYIYAPCTVVDIYGE